MSNSDCIDLLTFAGEIQNVLNRIVVDPSVEWIVFGFEDAEWQKLKPLEVGNGGFEALKAKISQEQLQYVLYKYTADSATNVLLITWFGIKVPQERALLVTQQAPVIRRRFQVCLTFHFVMVLGLQLRHHSTQRIGARSRPHIGHRAVIPASETTVIRKCQ